MLMVLAWRQGTGTLALFGLCKFMEEVIFTHLFQAKEKEDL
jgi:hypothetical protein